MVAIKTVIWTVFALTAITHGDELACDGDYTQNEKWCYKLMDAVDGIFFADQNCKEKGGNLVSIHSSKENAFVTSFGVDLFIGLQYDTTAKNYSWTDGTPFDLENWDSGYPMNPDYFGLCVILQKSGTWINSECAWKFHYVCKKPISSHQCPVPPNNQFFDSAELSSPGYPGNYISGLSCSYMLIVKNDYTVTLETSINEMGAGDTIEIFSGLVANNDYRIGVLNGSSGLKTFKTPQKENKMLVKFSSRSQTGGFWKFKFTRGCQEGWIDGGDSFPNYCYKRIEKRTYFNGAKRACEREGAQLISIHNAFQNKFINEKIGMNSGLLWLGFVYDNGSWKWIDGSSTGYTNWKSGEPMLSDGNCATMCSDGKWETHDCDPDYPLPVCFKPLFAVATNGPY